MDNDYARIKGRSTVDAPDDGPRLPKMPPSLARILSPDQQRTASRNRAIVEQFMPEFAPFVTDLIEMGILADWHDVKNIDVFPAEVPFAHITRSPSYTGTGSRETPDRVQDKIRRIASRLSELGLVLRSGGSDGADAAFEDGCDQAKGRKEIFLPWPLFNDHLSMLHTPSPEAFDTAASINPSWMSCNQPTRKLMARNSYQVLGASLSEPSKFLLCWTEDGAETESQCTAATGESGQAITLASRRNIPVVNLAAPCAMERLTAIVNAIKATENLESQ